MLPADSRNSLILYTELFNFGSYLKSKLMNYIDIMVRDNISFLDNDANGSLNGGPVVKSHIMYNKNGSIKFLVVSIWNLFSPEKVAKIKSVFNTLLFMKGTSSGSKECYLRIVSPTDLPTPFVVGKETPVLYEAVSPSPLKMELISVTKYLIEIQLAFLKQKHPNLQEKDFPMDCNQLQIVVVQLRKAAYQGHSDCGFLLNSHTGKIIIVSDRCLPFADEQQTITFCFCKCTEEGKPVTLSWEHK